MKRTHEAGRRAASRKRQGSRGVRGTAIGVPPVIKQLGEGLRDRLPPWMGLWLLAGIVACVLAALGLGLALAPRATVGAALAVGGLAFLARDARSRTKPGQPASRRKHKGGRSR